MRWRKSRPDSRQAISYASSRKDSSLTPAASGALKPASKSIVKRAIRVAVYPIALTGLWGSIFSRKHQFMEALDP